MRPAPGHIPVALGSRQAGLLRSVVGDRIPDNAPLNLLVERMAGSADTARLVVPFTGAANLAALIINVNSDWRGNTRLKELSRVGQVLAQAVADYSKHPAFRRHPTGLIGAHPEVILPTWGGLWWPELDAERGVLIPTVKKWKGTEFTTWRLESARRRPRSGPTEPHLLIEQPDHELLESYLTWT